MKNTVELFENMAAELANDLPYRNDLDGKVFIADSEQEATARFDAWMNTEKAEGIHLVGVNDHMFGSNICAITVVYRKSEQDEAAE